MYSKKTLNWPALSFAIIIILLFSSVPGFSQYENTRKSDYILGLKGGYSKIFGHYDSELMGTTNVGIYCIPYIHNFLMVEADIFYSPYKFSVSDDSYFHSLLFSIGILAYYPLLPFLEPYIGISFKGNYLYADAEKTDRQDHSFKVGLGADGGFFIPIASGVRTRIGLSYSAVWMSDKPFHTLNILIGVSFNYRAYVRRGRKLGFIKMKKLDDSARLKKIDESKKYYELGMGEFKEGNTKLAKQHFKKVISIDNNHVDAKKNLLVIQKNEKIHNSALLEIKKKRYFSAMVLLEKSGKYMASSREKLRKLRKKLTSLITGLKKEGISAYEKKKYEQCINIMKRILIIDPANKIARAYLPRAKKRLTALRELE
ncbi:tetratricopeptide repeat protein [Spirochaetota bacterium]